MNKRILLLMSVFLASIFIVIFLLSLLANRTKLPSDPLPSPTTVPSPTLLPNELIVTTALPEPDDAVSLLPFQKITVSFSEPVSLGSVVVITSPETEIDITQGASLSEIFIVPKSIWPTGRTDITLLQAVGLYGEKGLIRPFNYSITTALPTLSPEELEDVHP